MSYRYMQFSIELSLQHIIMVRLTEGFCRQPPFSEEVNHILMHENNEDDTEESSSKKLNAAAEQLAENIIASHLVDKDLPDTLRHDFEAYINGMMKGIIRFLTKIRDSMIKRADPNWREKLVHFIDHPLWDKFGYVDEPGMLRSYVDSAVTVDFHTWNQLCDFCLPNHITRFSKSITWKDCKETESKIPIFWYRKLNPDLADCDVEPEDIDYDETATIIAAIKESVAQGNLSAVRCFWNILDLDYEGEILDSNLVGMFKNDIDPDVFVFLVGLMDDDQWRSNLRDGIKEDAIRLLMQWPWIMCISTWEKLFDGYYTDHFCSDYVETFGRFRADIWRILLMSLEGLEAEVEFPKGIMYIRFSQIFEEIWESCLWNTVNEVERSTDAVFIAWKVLSLKDIELCRIVFGAVKKTRKALLISIAAKLWLAAIEELDGMFWGKFMAEIMADDEEKEFFRQLYKDNKEKDSPYTDCENLWSYGEHYTKFIV